VSFSGCLSELTLNAVRWPSLTSGSNLISSRSSKDEQSPVGNNRGTPSSAGGIPQQWRRKGSLNQYCAVFVFIRAWNTPCIVAHIQMIGVCGTPIKGRQFAPSGPDGQTRCGRRYMRVEQLSLI